LLSFVSRENNFWGGGTNLDNYQKYFTEYRYTVIALVSKGLRTELNKDRSGRIPF